MTIDLGFDPSSAATPGSGVYGLPHTPEEADVVLVPVPFEATASYRRGAAKGPATILATSRHVDLFDLETGRPYEAGIAMLSESPAIQKLDQEAKRLARPVIARGGDVAGRPTLVRAVERVNAISRRVNAIVRRTTERWLAKGKLVGIVGGDHSAAFGAIEAYANRYPGLGVLHLDAHADLREAFEGFTYSHASVMYAVVEQIPRVSRIVQVGLRDVAEEEVLRIRGSRGRLCAYFDPAMRESLLAGKPFSGIARQIVRDLPDDVYLSFDIDGLEPALCPNTGTPVPGGLTFHQVVHLLRAVAESGRRIVGLDLCEVAPGPSGDEFDGSVGARLLYKMIGYALRTRGQQRERPPRGRRGAARRRARR